MALPILKLPADLFHGEFAQVLQDLDELPGSDRFSLREIVFSSTNPADVERMTGFLKTRFPELFDC